MGRLRLPRRSPPPLQTGPPDSQRSRLLLIFVVALCGDIMTMPGLPRIPAANSIGVGEDGLITGLF